jgi:hypothetical protein
VDPVQIVAAIRSLAVDAGWVIGADAATPHNARLSELGRAGARSYELVGVEGPSDRAWVEQLAASSPGRVAMVAYELAEWIAGKETVRLDHDRGGAFRGVEWYDIIERHVNVGLPADLVADLGEGAVSDELIERLADTMYGARTAPGRVLLELHRAYDVSLRAALEPTFVAIADAVAREGEVTIGGIATFRRGGMVFLSAAGELTDYLNGGAPPTITIDPRLHLPADAATRLQDMCARLLTARSDLLLGAGLAVTVVELPGYDAPNPRTGQSIHVPPRRLPAFIGW